jgi:protein-disulfide isomerase
MPEDRLTKDEKKALRKLEWEEKAKKDKQTAMLKKYSLWAGTITLILVALGGLMWLVSQPTTTKSESITVAPVSQQDITEGPKDAKITLIEYADFQCPACSAYHPIITQLLEEYKNKIYYVFRIFPLKNIHPNAQISGQAAYAAHKQGAFFSYDDELYNKQKDWSEEQDPREIFISYAKSLKLDINKFTKDMNSDEAKNFVNSQEKEALSAGIMGTPTFIINGQKITNPRSLEEFKQIIENELNK